MEKRIEETGERIATTSEQRHKVNCSPDRGSSSTDDIVLPFPIEGQAFNGGPIKPPRNDRAGEGRIATACGLAMTESTDCHASLAMTESTDCHASLAMTDFAVQPIACHSEERSDVGIRVPEEQRVEQLKRLSGILIDRLEEAVEGKDFSVKEIRTYTNTLMDLRQIQMTDPELIAKEQQLRLIKLRREAGELAPRQLRICFTDDAEEASR